MLSYVKMSPIMSEKRATKTKEPKAAKAPKAAKTPSKAGWVAVIATGGKQYKVTQGDSLKIEKVIGNHQEGGKLTFDNVLLYDDGKGNVTVGTPSISGSKVEATIKKIGRAPKITVIKYKQKSRYFKKNGHRQPFFQVEIESFK
jgi:large subunit ribosomal protein L21